MKRFLSSSMLLVATGGAALAFENYASIVVPPMSPQLIQIDDPLFINNSLFGVSLSTTLGGSTILYQTTDTVDYTNNGVMNGIPGFDFETYPASVGQRHWAHSFANNGNGVGGGVINVTNAFAGENIFSLGGFSETTKYPLNFENAGLATLFIRATNVINTGLITMDNTGLIDIMGNSLDLRRGQMVMTGNTPPGSLDYGFGGVGTNSGGWAPLTDLTTNSARTPIFTNSAGTAEQFSLRGTTAYFESTNPVPDANNNVIWRIIFLLDSSAPGVTPSVAFGNFGYDFNIQWAGAFRDPRTGASKTNYFLFLDDPTVRRARLNPFVANNGIPSEFQFAEGITSFLTGPSATPSFINTPFPPAVTNDFAFVAASPEPLSLGTNDVVGGNPTNLPGRIQLTSTGTMDLSDASITGANYLSLKAADFLGNSNSFISAAYSDLDLGSTSGSLVLSNLLLPNLPAWTVAGRGGFGTGVGVEAFSGSYTFVSSNTPAGSTNTVTVTNDVRILIVSSALQPTTVASDKDISLHATNSVTISDGLTIIGSFFSDTTALTVTTNNTSAYSLFGSLILAGPDLLWSKSLPNLQYLTNWGIISTVNQANFADNMPDLVSPRSQATPYQAFVNYGQIINRGAFVLANFFANSGSIEEPVGDITLNITHSAINTNGTLDAPNGPISITAANLFISNSIVNSGRALIFKTPCFISDGYAFGNQFGHATNASLPNIVTNGNSFITSGGVQFQAKPETGDLLGTTVTDIAANNLLSINVWPGDDRGASPSGFAENTALGRLILQAGVSPSRFVFQGLNNNNALYVDSLQLLGSATNTDANGNLTAVTIQPGMKIYYAQALVNGVSIAEKLNGKNGGGFCWVSNYAGVYSSTNLAGILYNQALVISTHIDSDGDTIVNGNDTTPIPAGWTFDVANAGPVSCGGGGVFGGPDNGNTNNSSGTPTQTPGILALPLQPASSAVLSFKLAQGSYSGLFYDTNGVNPSSAGSFNATLSAKGNFSGKLQLGSNSYSFAKAFDQAGNCTMTVSNKSQTVLTLTLHLVNNDEITGQVAGGGWTAELLAFTSPKNASPFGTGKHALVLSTNADDSTTATGDGTGTMNLSKNGGIQWTVGLPDGVTVGDKSALSKDGLWPLYSSLSSGNGALIGWLQVTNGTSEVGGSVIWVLPTGPDTLYPGGLTNKLDAAGSLVKPIPAGSHSTLILSAPQLALPLTNSVTITGKNGQSGNSTLKFSVDVKNGLFSGSVIDPVSSQTLSFQGAFEKSGIGGGFFLNADKSQGGKVSLTPAN